MSKGKLVVLSAPSGTGKTSVCKQLLERNPKWVFSISATTRDLREGEVDGKDYIQMSNDKFEHCVKFGDFLEWEWVHGNKYGTLIGPLEDSLDNDELMLLDIDVKGGMNVMDEFPDETISIFLEPPGDDIPEQLEVLEERLSMRGNEAAKLIKNRLKRFAIEIEFKEKFKYNLVNEDILETVKEVEKIIKENTK
tara:strand:+ start:866 stop:1447 length:582 start_codon:yes stop_codon:yes gene_type:complete